MAFTSSCTAASSLLNTYETVSLPAIRLSRDTLFLPGQEVTLPTKPSRRRTKKTEGPLKKKPKNDYGGQTTRFRLDPHVAPKSSEPVMPLAPFKSNTGTSNPSAPSLVTTLTSSYGGDYIPPVPQIPPTQSIPMPAGKSPPMSAMQPMSSVSKITSLQRAEEHSPLPSSGLPSPSPASEVNRPREHHYRRDYEKGLTFHEPGPPHGSAYHSTGQPSGAQVDVGSSTKSGGQPPLLTTYRHPEERIRGKPITPSLVMSAMS